MENPIKVDDFGGTPIFGNTLFHTGNLDDLVSPLDRLTLRLSKLTFDFAGWSSIKLLEEGLTNLSGAAWRYAILRVAVSVLRVGLSKVCRWMCSRISA